jgi:hypothetical protein
MDLLRSGSQTINIQKLKMLRHLVRCCWLILYPLRSHRPNFVSRKITLILLRTCFEFHYSTLSRWNFKFFLFLEFEKSFNPNSLSPSYYNGEKKRNEGLKNHRRARCEWISIVRIDVWASGFGVWKPFAFISNRDRFLKFVEDQTIHPSRLLPLKENTLVRSWLVFTD